MPVGPSSCVFAPAIVVDRRNVAIGVRAVRRKRTGGIVARPEMARRIDVESFDRAELRFASRQNARRTDVSVGAFGEDLDLRGTVVGRVEVALAVDGKRIGRIETRVRSGNRGRRHDVAVRVDGKAKDAAAIAVGGENLGVMVVLVGLDGLEGGRSGGLRREPPARGGLSGASREAGGQDEGRHCVPGDG